MSLDNLHSTGAKKGFLVLLVVSVCIRDTHAEEQGACSDGPPEGMWLMSGFVVLPENPGGETPAVRNIVKLRRETDVAYQGKGVGLTVADPTEEQPREMFIYDILGVYDNKTNILSVALTDCEGGMHDAAQWTYDCETLSGPVVNFLGGSLTRVPLRQELIFLG